jgi:ADP-heptose:LPS heptosyltransferase
MSKKKSKLGEQGQRIWNAILGRLILVGSRSALPWNQIQKALIMTSDEIQESIQILPMLQLFAEKYPKINIDVMAGETAQSLLIAHPAINDVIAFQTPWIMKMIRDDFSSSEQSFMNIAWDIRRRQYDVVISAYPDFRLNLAAGLSGAPYRIGYTTTGGVFCLTDYVTYDPILPNSYNHLNLLTSIGVTPYYIAPQLTASEDDLQSTRNIMEGLIPSVPIAVLAPVASCSECQWPAESFRSLIDLLIEDGFQILIIGGPKDKLYLEKMTLDLSTDEVQIWNYPNSGEVIALARYTKLYIGVENRTSFIMAASGTPSVMLAQHNLDIRYIPSGSRFKLLVSSNACSSLVSSSAPSSARKCDCVKTISADEVKLAAEEIL